MYRKSGRRGSSSSCTMISGIFPPHPHFGFRHGDQVNEHMGWFAKTAAVRKKAQTQSILFERVANYKMTHDLRGPYSQGCRFQSTSECWWRLWWCSSDDTLMFQQANETGMDSCVNKLNQAFLHVCHSTPVKHRGAAYAYRICDSIWIFLHTYTRSWECYIYIYSRFYPKWLTPFPNYRGQLLPGATWG